MISAHELYSVLLHQALAKNIRAASTAAVATTTTTSSSAATVATMMMMLMMLMMLVMVLMMDGLRHIVCVRHMVRLYDDHQKHHQQTEGKGELHLGSLVLKRDVFQRKQGFV